MIKIVIINIFFLIFLLTSSSFAIEFTGKFTQGHFIIGKTDSGSIVFIDKKKVKVSQDGYFAFGIE